MKKVMLFIVSMLFSLSVSAASLTVTPDAGFTGSIDDNGSDSVFLSSDKITESFTHVHTVTNTSDFAQSFRLWVTSFFASIPEPISFSVVVGTTQIAVPGNTYSFYNDVVLAAQESISVTVSAVLAEGTRGADYDLLLETPIPAALFLFAPALLGFFGLRRRANALVA